jgi:acetylornithine/N-succinyldiaminopimelate aminotransferase
VLTAKTLLRLLPPLTITYDEIDRGLEILEATLKEVRA